MKRSIDLWLALALAVALAVSTSAPRSPLAAQPPTFEDRTEVVVRDVLVELSQGRGSEWLRGDRRPPSLRAGALEVLGGGRPLTVVDVERRPPDGPEGRYQFVVYFELELPSSAEVRWAASLLAARTGELVSLGDVEVWIADPEPRLLVASTDDAALLDARLSQLALFGEGGDRLASLRHEMAEELAAAVTARANGRAAADIDRGIDRGIDHPSDRAIEPMIESLGRREHNLIVGRQDRFLLTLADRPLPTTPRRVVLLAGLNADRSPVSLLRERATGLAPDGVPDGAPDGAPDGVPDGVAGEASVAPAVPAPNDPPSKEPGDLEQSTTGLAAALAARGWLIVPLVPPPAEAERRRGLRLGKLRFVLLGVVYEEDRKPELARAALDLGRSLLAQGRWSDAEDAFRQALHHFSGDPATGSEQAIALAGLGEALDQQGKRDAGRRAFEMAVDLDPELEREHAAFIGLSAVEPERLAEILAHNSGGAVIDDGRSLDASLAGLQRRLRVSFQVDEIAPGTLATLEIRYRGSAERLRHPRWTGTGTVEPVSEARVRVLFDAQSFARDLAVDARWLRDQPGGSLRVTWTRLPGHRPEAGEFEDGVGEPPSDRGPLRISVGVRGEDHQVSLVHRVVEAEATEAVVPIVATGPAVAVVLVEDLGGGAWGVRRLESWQLR